MNTPPETTLGTQLRSIVTLMDGAVDEAHRWVGLDFRAIYTPVVRLLLHQDAASVRDLARAVGVTHSSMSQTVAQMRRAGLIDSAPSSDGRERRVRLSQRCHRQLPVIQAQWAATERAAAELYARLEFDVSAIAGQVIAELRERPFLSEDNQALDRWLSPDEQRIAYDQLAALVAEHYFDAAAASRIADSLIASLVEADGIAATEFANQLTTNLRTSDAHFGVQWGPWMSRRRRTGASGENLPALDVVHHDGVGVLTIRRFEDADAPAVSDAIAETLRHLADAQAIVVDVRQNAGGWPSMVEVVLGSLVGPGPAHILTMYSREDPFESWSRPSMGPSRLWELPVVVVVDGETASAAESLAYALQSLGRARIVGTRTAGAANPGRPFTTATGFSIFIPTASPRDPRTGANWEGGGVIPDHLVEPDVTERAIALARDRCRYIIQKEGRPVHSGISYQCPFGTS